MAAIRFRPGAREDLRGIWRYVARDDPRAADRLTRAIERKLAPLAANPMLGRARPELRADLRSLAHRPYVILYRPLDDGIEVVRILHGARDLAALLEEEG